MVFLCLKIFFVRIMDVAMGTIRTIITIKGNRLLAAFIGFFEALIWFIVVKEALTTEIKSIWIVLSYSAGFATGTYFGTILSNHFINGKISFQIVLSSKNDQFINFLRQKGFAVSVIDVKGYKTDKYMLFIEINSKQGKYLTSLVKKYDQKAFIVANETKYVINGYFDQVN